MTRGRLSEQGPVMPGVISVRFYSGGFCCLNVFGKQCSGAWHGDQLPAISSQKASNMKTLNRGPLCAALVSGSSFSVALANSRVLLLC